LLIISFEIDIIDVISLHHYRATTLLTVGSTSALKHPGCQDLKPQPMSEGVLLS